MFDITIINVINLDWRFIYMLVQTNGKSDIQNFAFNFFSLNKYSLVMRLS